MYNNDVTYDERWATSENKEYLYRLEDKYLHRSVCAANCPVGWAKEVYELLEHLDSEFGIEYNTSTLDGFLIKKNVLKGLFVSPIVGPAYSFYNIFIRPYFIKDFLSSYYSKTTMRSKLSSVLRSFYFPIELSLRNIKSLTLYKFLNFVKRPKIRLDQVKEKYGELNVYYSSPDYLRDYIDLKIRETEMKLAMKGCYYPVESFYYASSNWYQATQHHPTEYVTSMVTHSDGSVHSKVEVYTYREAMANLGLDLNDIKTRADARVASNHKE